MKREEKVEEARFFIELGESVEQAAALVGLALDTLQKYARMFGAPDVSEAITSYKIAAHEALGHSVDSR